MNNSIFYSITDIMSYNALLNFIIGERGVGKSYSSKKFVLNRFIKHDEEFVYLRRYKSELKTAVGTKDKPKFWNQIAHEFKDHKLTNSADTFYCDGKPCGYAMPLSIANILKSSTYDKVKTIIFDEFIIDKGTYHYLPNEVEQLLDVIETVGRLRDVRVIFLGNAISSTNPYFIYFDLSLPYQKDVKLFKDGLILVNYIKNEKYREVKKNSKFGKLIEGTNYSKYAIDNEFLRDSKTFLCKKSANSKYYFSISYHDQTFGIWRDSKENVLYVSFDFDPNSQIKFVIDKDDHNETTFLVRSRDSVHIKSLINYYKASKLRFENQKCKNLFMDALGKCLGY